MFVTSLSFSFDIKRCAYLYFKVKGTVDSTVIFVKKAPGFSDPKPKWEKTTYTAHENAEVM